jgi:hypothetical protein
VIPSKGQTCMSIEEGKEEESKGLQNTFNQIIAKFPKSEERAVTQV